MSENEGGERERERNLRLRDSISIICRFVDSELCDYAPPFLLFPPVPSRPPFPPRLSPSSFSPSCSFCPFSLPPVRRILPLSPSATATPSQSSAPEPSIRLFARNRFHVFGPLLHLYKRARTTNIGHCARRHERFALRARPRPRLRRLRPVLVPGFIVARLPSCVRRSAGRSRIDVEFHRGLPRDTTIGD